MRLALDTEFYYPHLGGVTEHVHHLTLELRRRGHDVTIITSRMVAQAHRERRPPGCTSVISSGTARSIRS